jgi:hypothetical protein
MNAQVTRYGFTDMQVCVPATWTDEEVVAFAESSYPCGTRSGWNIRRRGDKALRGDMERVTCEERRHCVHIMLDA